MSLTQHLPTPRIDPSPLGILSVAAPFTTLIPNLKGTQCAVIIDQHPASTRPWSSFLMRMPEVLPESEWRVPEVIPRKKRARASLPRARQLAFHSNRSARINVHHLNQPRSSSGRKR